MRGVPVRSFLLALSIAVAVIPPVQAQDACPCVPLPRTWYVKTCADWNCASIELLLANGDPLVFAVPIGVGDPRWLVIRRITSGVYIENPAEPFRIEQFDRMTKASARFAEIGQDRRPMLMTSPDGQVLVLSLKEAERRRITSRR